MRVIRFFSIKIIWIGLISLVMGCVTNKATKYGVGQEKKKEE